MQERRGHREVQPRHSATKTPLPGSEPKLSDGKFHKQMKQYLCKHFVFPTLRFIFFSNTSPCISGFAVFM